MVFIIKLELFSMFLSGEFPSLNMCCNIFERSIINSLTKEWISNSSRIDKLIKQHAALYIIIMGNLIKHNLNLKLNRYWNYFTSGEICPDNSNLVLSDIEVGKWDIVDQTLFINGLLFSSPLTISLSRPKI